MEIFTRFPFRWKVATQLCLALIVLVSVSGCAGLPFFTPQEPVTLRFVYIDNAANYAPLAEEFNRQNPFITIELDPVPAGPDSARALADKARTADVIRAPSILIDEKVAAALVPLDSYIATDQSFRTDDLFPNSLEGLRMAGKQVGVPAGINPMVFMYNADKFAASGVRPPPPDWVLDEFLSAAVAINNSDLALVGSPQYTIGYCTHPQLPDTTIFSFVFGGGIFDNIYNPTRATLNSPENIAMLTWYASLKNEFGVMPDASRTGDIWALVNRGSCGFWMDWLDRSTFGNTSSFEVDMLPMPAYGTPFAVALIDSYSIMAPSQNQDAAWKWISYLVSQPTSSGRLVPPAVAKISDQEFASQVNSDALVIARALPPQTVILGVEMYRDPRLGRVMGLFSEAVVAVLEGGLDPQTALDAAQQRADEIFQR
jgi:ABC-type glycerol-3-phosphate transport system substrate-binding protein